MWQIPPLQPEEVLIYLRKSRADDPLLSVNEVLAKHEQMLDDWAERSLPGAGRIPEGNRYREVVSGETIDSRPRLLEVLRRMESPAVKAVLCVEPERLSRGSMKEIGRLVELFRYSNTYFLTTKYSYDLRDERDRNDLERELMQSNYFLEYQKRIQQNGRLLAAQNGWYIGTWPPYGYNKVTVKDGKRTCFTLEPNPDQAPIVRLIFEMYARGESSHAIARHLNKIGAPTAKGGKWAAESLKRMRSNEHYLGKVVWNRRKNVRTVEDGEVIVSRPLQTDYHVFPGRHEAIVDQELWDAVQEIRDKIPPVKDKTKYANMFSGLIYCQCGRAMSRRTYKKNEPRLLCLDQTTCRTPSCTVAEMERAIVQLLRETIADFELKMEHNTTDHVETHRRLVAQLEKRLEELNKQELSQWDKYTQEDMPKHIFEQLNAKVLKEKAETQEALCTARDTLPEPIDYERKQAMFSDALRALEDPDAPTKEKNLLLKKCIDRIEYSRKVKPGGNRRWGDPEPMELDVHLLI